MALFRSNDVNSGNMSTASHSNASNEQVNSGASGTVNTAQPTTGTYNPTHGASVMSMYGYNQSLDAPVLPHGRYYPPSDVPDHIQQARRKIYLSRIQALHEELNVVLEFAFGRTNDYYIRHLVDNIERFLKEVNMQAWGQASRTGGKLLRELDDGTISNKMDELRRACSDGTGKWANPNTFMVKPQPPVDLAPGNVCAQHKQNVANKLCPCPSKQHIADRVKTLQDDIAQLRKEKSQLQQQFAQTQKRPLQPAMRPQPPHLYNQTMLAQSGPQQKFLQSYPQPDLAQQSQASFFPQQFTQSNGVQNGITTPFQSFSTMQQYSQVSHQSYFTPPPLDPVHGFTDSSAAELTGDGESSSPFKKPRMDQTTLSGLSTPMSLPLVPTTRGGSQLSTFHPYTQNPSIAPPLQNPSPMLQPPISKSTTTGLPNQQIGSAIPPSLPISPPRPMSAPSNPKMPSLAAPNPAPSAIPSTQPVQGTTTDTGTILKLFFEDYSNRNYPTWKIWSDGTVRNDERVAQLVEIMNFVDQNQTAQGLPKCARQICTLWIQNALLYWQRGHTVRVS